MGSRGLAPSPGCRSMPEEPLFIQRYTGLYQCPLCLCGWLQGGQWTNVRMWRAMGYQETATVLFGLSNFGLTTIICMREGLSLISRFPRIRTNRRIYRPRV